MVQGAVPRESHGGAAYIGPDLLESVLAHKDQLLAQKGMELPTALPAELVPVLRKGLGSGPGAGALRKMLPTHSEAQHPTQPPGDELFSEAPAAPPALSTDSPTMTTQAASENGPSMTSVDKEEPDAPPSGKPKHPEQQYFTDISMLVLAVDLQDQAMKVY